MMLVVARDYKCGVTGGVVIRMVALLFRLLDPKRFYVQSDNYNYEQALETADWIHKQIGEQNPVIGLICGLAFNGIVEIMEETIR